MSTLLLANENWPRPALLALRAAGLDVQAVAGLDVQAVAAAQAGATLSARRARLR